MQTHFSWIAVISLDYLSDIVIFINWHSAVMKFHEIEYGVDYINEIRAKRSSNLIMKLADFKKFNETIFSHWLDVLTKV